MSSGLGLATILGCLDAGEKLIGLKPEGWQGTESESAFFAEIQAGFRSGLSKFNQESLRSFATANYADVALKMAEWKMRLDRVPDCGPSAVYMLSQLREYLKWVKAGKKVMRHWPEFVLTEGVKFFSIRIVDKVEYVVRVEVEGGDEVYLLRYDHPVDNAGLGILRTINLIELLMEPIHPEDIAGVQIPCVFADLKPDLNWILGMMNKEYFIAYAQQKILFGMNEIGFAVREETAMAMRKCAVIEQPYILSPNGESFLFWRRRAGVPFPISMFQFTREDFKDPGDLNKIVE